MTPQELKSLAVSTLTGRERSKAVFKGLAQSRATCLIGGGGETGRLLFKAHFHRGAIGEIEILVQWNNAGNWSPLGKMETSIFHSIQLEEGVEQRLKPLFKIPDPELLQ